MTENKSYTNEELKQFDRLTMSLSSRSQMERIEGRLHINEFIKKHGREKCDAMFAALKAKDAKNGL